MDIARYVINSNDVTVSVSMSMRILVTLLLLHMFSFTELRYLRNMSETYSSLWKRMQNYLSSSFLCCVPKYTSENHTDDDVLEAAEADQNSLPHYVHVDEGDLAKIPYVGDIPKCIPNADAKRAPTNLDRFRRFLNNLKPRGRRNRTRAKGLSCFQGFRDHVRNSSLRNKTYKGKMIDVAPAPACPQESIDYLYMSADLIAAQREEMMKNILPDEFIGIVDEMTVDLDILIYAEESKRMLNILLDDYIDAQDIADMDDRMKAAKTEEIYNSLSKSEQHAIRHHSFILVHDILSSL